jgi:hypothetical protein
LEGWTDLLDGVVDGSRHGLQIVVWVFVEQNRSFFMEKGTQELVRRKKEFYDNCGRCEYRLVAGDDVVAYRAGRTWWDVEIDWCWRLRSGVEFYRRANCL